MSKIGKRISRKIDKGIFKFKLIEPGDKILLGISGGKDSLTLAYNLIEKSKGCPIPFQLEAVNIEPDFPNGTGDKSFLELVKSWGLDCPVIKVPVKARLKPGKTMNCYWCSTQRRMELMKEAQKRGCNKIALGHHMDDILETFLMNIAYKGELSTMLPLMKYDKYPFTVIRPLAYVQESEIIQFSKDLDFQRISCSCNFDTRSRRHPARDAIKSLSDHPSVRDSMFKALGNPNNRYMF
ncbi:MAG: tRNA 2-thiocytidine biosynthesis protein TtcA [Spirochaetaceae bacterium]|jgi:tRNA 2-thiocytidine biosynthesis protein TtcA|nr:tRNA 2-thiocytidine biosynthesis protein TtcA [Spirochaetaceae bacterium]